MKARLRQVIVYVSNMERSIAFYRDTLGLPLRSESPGWSEFDVDGLTLALHISRTPGSAPEAMATGQAELSLEVSDLDQAHTTSQSQGIAVNDPMLLENLGKRIVTLRDPDGLAITLVEATG